MAKQYDLTNQKVGLTARNRRSAKNITEANTLKTHEVMNGHLSHSKISLVPVKGGSLHKYESPTKEFESDKDIIVKLVTEAKLSTPFLALRQDKIDHIHELFDEHLPFVSQFYAMKSNPTPALIKYLIGLGIGMDVASTNELVMAIKQGATSDKIIISNPVKDDSLLYGMFIHGIHAFAADSIGELIKVARFRDANFPDSSQCRPIIRIQVPAQGVEIDLGKKFGCSPHDAINLFRLAYELNLPPLGISFHVGTQCTQVESYAWALQICDGIRAEILDKLGYDIEVVNIGGGFCSLDTAEQNNISIDKYFSKLSDFLYPLTHAGPKLPPVKIYAEPGRIFSSAAGITTCQIIGRAERPDGPAIYLNDGIYGCFSTRLVEKTEYKFEFFPKSKSKIFSKLIPYTVFGPTCDSVDVISYKALLPINLEVGDYLMASNTGAYSIATACSFNGFNPPATFFVSKDSYSTLNILNGDGNEYKSIPSISPSIAEIA